MKITYDPDGDAMYIQLNTRPIKETEPVNDSFMLDLDEEGEVVGIEILDASLLLQDPPGEIEFKLLVGPPIEAKDVPAHLHELEGENR